MEVRKKPTFYGAYLLKQAPNFLLFSFPGKYYFFENTFSRRILHRLDNFAFSENMVDTPPQNTNFCTITKSEP